MIIQLKNFGPIEHFEFDTDKDMHFIFGENNIGKSYAISAVYLILKNLNNINFKDRTIQSANLKLFIESINHITAKNKEANENDITNESEHLLYNILEQDYLPVLYQSFLNAFSPFTNLKNRLSKKDAEIKITSKGSTFYFIFSENELLLKDVKLNFDVVLRYINTNRTPEYTETKAKSLRLYYNVKTNTIHDMDIFFMLFGLFSIDSKDYPNHIYFLPSSRCGLYNALNAFGAIFAKLSQSRNLIGTQINIPTFPEQLSDYFLNLSTIKKLKKEDGYSKIAQLIELKILKGEVIFDSNDNKIYYKTDKPNMRLDLAYTSSMISEVAPIVAYLKYIIAEYSNRLGIIESGILFIEEPEAHLHPKIQIELIKIFAQLPKLGLKIAMTSHSNYMFNKLSNMILAKEIDFNTISVAHMKMGEKGSYVDTHSMQIDETGIEDNNFADVAEELYMERLKLYEQTH